MVGPPRILGDTVYNMRRITLGAWGSRISGRGSDVMSFLNLWKQQLGEVPDAVWDRVDLETLILAENGLTRLSARLAGLQHLRTLDLSHNALVPAPNVFASFA